MQSFSAILLILEEVKIGIDKADMGKTIISYNG